MAGGYDGTIKIDTRLDTENFEKDSKKVNQSAKSQAAKLAAEYRKQGMNASDAFKKAWSEVEHSSKSAAKKSETYWKNSTKNSSKSVESIKASFGSLKTMLGKALIEIGGAYGLFQLGKQAIDLASDLQEVQNVVDTAFKSMSYKMEEFADTCIEQFGLSKLSAKEMGSTFMAMASNMVPSMEQASDMAVELTGRAADMASFYNKTASETATALNSIFTGETETLKQYGVVMTEANLQQYAYRQGIKKTLSDMTQAEKVQLRYNYVMEQTSLAAGDFAKTSDSWANQTRILSEQFKELLSVLGSGLIQVLTPAVKGLNAILSKLIDVANALGTIMSKLLGLNSVKLSSSGQSAADGFQAATDSVEGYTNAVNKASKASKGAVAEFDELTMLSSNSSGSSDSLDFGSTGILTEEVEASTEATAEISERFEKVLGYVNSLGNAFEKGFLEGLKDAKNRLKDISLDLSGIRDSILGIFADGTVADAFADMGLKLSESAGNIVGAFASMGITMAENLIGGIDYALQSDASRIKEYLISMFDLTGEISEIIGNFAVAFADIFSALGGENGQRLTGAFISVFANAFMSVTETAAKFGADILDAITRPIIENASGIKQAFDELLGILADSAEQIRDTVVYGFSAFSDMYDEHIGPFIESLGDGLSYLVDLGLTIWNDYLLPMFEELGIYLNELLSENIEPLIDAVMLSLGSVINLLEQLWNHILVPFLAWVITNIVPAIKPIFTTICKIVKEFFALVINIVTDLLTIFSGIIDFLVNSFTGDWEAAWDGFVNIVKGCINLIIDCINGMVAALFAGINYAVDLINALLENIPGDIMAKIGFTGLPHFDAPQIPRLATGTVVPPGMSQFLAVLGDNNKETEVVSPLSTMKEALMEAIMEMGGIGQNGDIVINIDGKEVFRVVRDQNREYKKMTGQSAFA